MRRLTTLTLPLLLAGFPVAAQDVVKPVLDDKKSFVVFSPMGGYAQQNFLKRFKQGDQPTWATQNGAVAELIRRSPIGSKIRIGTFKLSDQGIVDALFHAAKTRNVEVKLWLKGPPGLTYMVSGHEAIAQRANRYLKERAQQGKQDTWGDFQVQLGTAAKMHAFGKYNDMHEKFGIVALNDTHGPGYNNAFLGTSNLGHSSDAYHNEHRVFFLENAKATQRLWQEFKRLWDNLGECRTYVDGDASKGVNQTPEQKPRIKLPGGGYADEEANDPLQFRFTYEKRGGSFHRISDDFVKAIGEARYLDDGETVWVAQFGFGISKISNALLRAARANPKVNFRVMVHMKEGDSWALQRLVDAKLKNLHVNVKWDSHKLKLSKGARPGLPGPTDPGPSLLHHKTLVVGKRVMITGSFNFFSDADDQGENVVIIRNHLDDTYEHLIEDTRAEFEAMAKAGVLFDGKQLFGSKGLYKTVQRYSNKPGFLRTIEKLSSQPKSLDDLHAAVTNSSDDDVAALTKDELKDYVKVLETFAFAEKDASGKIKRTDDPDVKAHAGKAKVRQDAKQPPKPVEVSGEITLGSDGVTLNKDGKSYLLSSKPEARSLRKFDGEQARVLGIVTPVEGSSTSFTVEVKRVLSPVEGQLSGLAQVSGSQRSIKHDAGGARAFGKLARSRTFKKLAGKKVTVRGWVFSGSDGAATAVYVLAIKAKVEKAHELTYNYEPIGHEVQPGDEVWIERSGWSYLRVRTKDGKLGYIPAKKLTVGEVVGGGIIGGIDAD